MDTVHTVFPTAMEAFAADRPDVVLYDFETVAAGRVAARLLDAVPVQVCPSHAANESFSMRAQMWDADHPVMAEGAKVMIGFMGEHGIGPEEMARYGAEWDLHNLVFLPRAFQIEGDTFDDRFAFVGPTFSEPPADSVRWTPPGDGRGWRWCPWGPRRGDRAGFFRQCAQAFDPAKLARRDDPRTRQRPGAPRAAARARRGPLLAAAPAGPAARGRLRLPR